MSFFSRVFRKDGGSKKAKRKGQAAAEPAKPTWTDAWLRTEVGPEEVQELLRGCTVELKARALDVPFLLLPFRLTSDPSAARTFIRNYFSPPAGRPALRGESLLQELRLTEPMVLCSVVKWCWSRLPGGVVTWEAYELFKVGEQDSQLARDAFSTFIPISVDSDARTKIIFDFFELMAAIAAHGKNNGLGGRKLSRFAGWWAFEHVDSGKGFENSYKTWANAADATSHLFFAYLRSLSPDSVRGTNGISALPLSLQSLVQATEYPPEAPSLLQSQTTKVVMIVDTVSPTPFALLRRAKNFEYRDSDHALQEFSNYEDPVKALTEECHRVLRSISTINQSEVSTTKVSTSLRDASWSRFEDIGFGGAIEESEVDDEPNHKPAQGPLSLRSVPVSRNADLGRPTTPSWADFLSTGFTEEQEARNRAPPLLMPPDKLLPSFQANRGQSSQSHKRGFDTETPLDPGELASISSLDLDDSFWWVWISSLAGEEPVARKAVFGRCALLETLISGGRWLILEEQVKGAAPEPDAGAYIVEKKSFFGFRTKKGRLTRRQSSAKKINEPYKGNKGAPESKTSIAPDQHARIQAAAAALQRKNREQERAHASAAGKANDNLMANKTNSVLSLQPAVASEASHAMKWASNYDKSAVRTAYLENDRAGTGAPVEGAWNGNSANGDRARKERDLPSTPKQEKPVSPEPMVPPKSSQPRKDLQPAAKVDPMPEHPATNQDSGNTGLKAMFGKKKPETPTGKPLEVETSSAVAAAKAALEGRVAQSQQQPSPQKKSPSRRLSVLGRKKTSESSTPAASKPATPPAEQAKPAPAASPEPTPAPAPAPVSPAAEYDGPPKTRREAEFDQLSRVDTNEQAEANREFSNFDHQNPIVDAPAFVPEDSPSPTTEQRPVTPPPAKAPESPKPTESRPVNGHEKPASPRSPGEAQNRWAQIHKNVADRAAASPRAQKDGVPEGPSQQDSIELRAARIRARIAALTQDMQTTQDRDRAP